MRGRDLAGSPTAAILFVNRASPLTAKTIWPRQNTPQKLTEVSYAEPPSYVAEDADARKATTDISSVMRLTQSTGATVVPGADAALEAAGVRRGKNNCRRDDNCS